MWEAERFFLYSSRLLYHLCWHVGLSSVILLFLLNGRDRLLRLLLIVRLIGHGLINLDITISSGIVVDHILSHLILVLSCSIVEGGNFLLLLIGLFWNRNVLLFLLFGGRSDNLDGRRSDNSFDFLLLLLLLSFVLLNLGFLGGDHCIVTALCGRHRHVLRDLLGRS